MSGKELVRPGLARQATGKLLSPVICQAANCGSGKERLCPVAHVGDWLGHASRLPAREGDGLNLRMQLRHFCLERRNTCDHGDPVRRGKSIESRDGGWPRANDCDVEHEPKTRWMQRAQGCGRAQPTKAPCPSVP